jgi:uncharacterized protein GlcG (DUF336 family)
MFARLLPLLAVLALAPVTLFADFSPAVTPPAYAATDLERIAQQAADRALERFPRSVIAIVDRDGRELALFRANGEPPAAITTQERFRAVSKAGTAVFLSSNEQSFTPRTALFIIQQNFPPGVRNRPTGPLVGVGFSNMAYSDVNYFRSVADDRIPLTRLTGSPGGVPLYKHGRLFAGIGVTGDGTEADFETEPAYALVNNRPDFDEAVALAGQLGYAPPASIHGSRVLIDGLRVPYVATPAARARTPGSAPAPAIAAPPAPVAWPALTLGGVPGQLRPRTGVQAGPATADLIADPAPGLLDGQPRLTAAEVRSILAAAAARARQTRAGIRLPAGRPAQVFISVVSNPGTPGQPPVVLGTFRTPDATLFSWDVSVQKARTVVYYINADPLRAVSSRTVGFLSQKHFPPGIEGRPAGPFFGEQLAFSLPLLTGDPLLEPELPNGITIFPGGFPLYRNGVLVGAVGVSGDGIEQDDLIAASGAVGWQPSASLRADYDFVHGVRLPYAKFPRDAQLRREVRPVTPGP